jgi:predicted RNA-binding protein YlqC (UPF0109 family)
MSDSTEMDQAFVEYVVKSIVDNPDAVVVTRSVDDRGVLLELTVDPEDMGKIIGKAGATAKALRTLLRVLGAKSDARFNLKITEPEGSEPRERHGDTMPEEVTEGEKQDQSGQPEEQDRAEAIRAKAREGLEDLDDLDI